MEFEQIEQQLSEIEFTTFEGLLKKQLPISFKQHYLNNNGGYPPYEYVKGINHIFTINGFYPIKYGMLPIEKLMKDYQNSGVDLKGNVPFAYDNGGNIYVISMTPHTYGYVYIIEAEFISEGRYILVSRSFEDFLDSFYNE